MDMYQGPRATLLRWLDQGGPTDVSQWPEIARALRLLLEASPSPEGADAVEAGGLADDVVRLVIAARLVAFGDIVMGADGDGWDALRELDSASEAFADRVPWDDEPTHGES